MIFMFTRLVARRFATLFLAFVILASGIASAFASVSMMTCGASANGSGMSMSVSQDRDPDSMHKEGKLCVCFDCLGCMSCIALVSLLPGEISASIPDWMGSRDWALPVARLSHPPPPAVPPPIAAV